MKTAIQKILFLFLCFNAMLFTTTKVNAQLVTLNADDPGAGTYETINNKLAPGANAVESAECIHPSFGRHIVKVFDAGLNKNVFEFYIHVTPDNDRCIASVTDRQRVEIKTYESSPANLKTTNGETVTYKWRFKIPVGFQPSSSFTHIHQVKAVGGDEGDPIFTLTPRKGTSGNPNKMELIYVKDMNSGTIKYATPNLSLFEGEWVECTEFLSVSANGYYSIVVKRLSDNMELINYTNANIQTIRPDNTFIRPKWGIYRSLNTPADLRDESIRFSDFSIQEGTVLPVQQLQFNGAKSGHTIDLHWQTSSEVNTSVFILERSADGVSFTPLKTIPAAGNSNSPKQYSVVDPDPLTGINYYRLVLKNIDESFVYSTVIKVSFSDQPKDVIKIYPNPVSANTKIELPSFTGSASVIVHNNIGQKVLSFKGSKQGLEERLKSKLTLLKAGYYFISIQTALIKTKTTFIIL